ncbi:cell division protein FtsL [Marinobacterium arenosum]|uniref:cell division protein FtsL n=1 Tax=Marinobacterium arenosum TaxID=2862496 RepID=UPI001C958DE1|nr:cell division protein FtsL [Marinobacterium arenosum]MBY4676605.1 cell division protein FtsL [Marinobacterium arenosum]
MKQRILDLWRRLRSAPVEAPLESGSLPLATAAELVRPLLILLVLVLTVLLSSVAVIFSAYQYRLLFHQHQTLVQQRDDLQVEWGQLLLEQSAWAANNRVEIQARKRLNMLVPEPGVIEIVRHGQ